MKKAVIIPAGLAALLVAIGGGLWLGNNAVSSIDMPASEPEMRPFGTQSANQGALQSEEPPMVPGPALFPEEYRPKPVEAAEIGPVAMPPALPVDVQVYRGDDMALRERAAAPPAPSNDDIDRVRVHRYSSYPVEAQPAAPKAAPEPQPKPPEAGPATLPAPSAE